MLWIFAQNMLRIIQPNIGKGHSHPHCYALLENALATLWKHLAEPENKLCQTRQNRFLGLFQFVLIAKYSLFAHGKKNRKTREKIAKLEKRGKDKKWFSAKWFQSLILREGEGSSSFVRVKQRTKVSRVLKLIRLMYIYSWLK